MRFALIQEGDFPEGIDIPRRYHEMTKEAIFAEKMGFDTYCLSEQHFLKETCTVSSPEVFLADVAARTDRIRLRITSAVLLSFNHPIRVAERLNTLDILSNGRAELGTARSNNLQTLEGFGVSPTESRAQWNESIDIILASLTRDPFEFKGKFWTVPPRTLSPVSVQKPHPPIFVSATSLETHRNAGERGLGVMTGNSILGWEYAEKCIAAYKEGLVNAKPAAGSILNNYVGFFVAVAHCAEHMEQARQEATRVTKTFVDFVIWLFSKLGESSPDYAYLSQIRKIEERKDDLEFVLDSAPYFMVGTPDYLVERLRRLEQMGVNEVLLRIDGMGHDVNMQALEMFGTKVIPRMRGSKSRGTAA
jgi:alkanesulfonate monooxygenase SsuD/methylene tetrahydromethanopterin reductase-like flavin-dependent oxidoreductase (luciferase family)